MEWNSRFGFACDQFVAVWDFQKRVRNALRRNGRVGCVSRLLSALTDLPAESLPAAITEPLDEVLTVFEVPATEGTETHSDPNEWATRLIDLT